MNKKGFTLVELMTVVTIIVLLSLAAVYSFNVYTMKARDADRKANVNILRLAVEMNYEFQESYEIKGFTTGLTFRMNANLGPRFHRGTYKISMVELFIERGYLKSSPVKIFKDANEIRAKFNKPDNFPCSDKPYAKDIYMYQFDKDEFSISAYLDFATEEERINSSKILGGTDTSGHCRNYGRNYGIGGNRFD